MHAITLSPSTLHLIETYKGLGFVVATAFLIQSLVQSHAMALHRVHEERHAHSLEVAGRLALAIEKRDECTGQHNARIGGYAALIGRQLGLDLDRLDRLTRAAPLHDVGKVAISDAILNKPGPLTDEEFAIIRTHAEIGAEILNSDCDPFLKLAAEIARTHHEAWDGSGYPIGLLGAAIPLEGRIVAVCDVFDALVSERPYKRPWSVDEAIEEIVRLRGTRFDPEIVDAFLQVLPEIRRVATTGGIDPAR